MMRRRLLVCLLLVAKPLMGFTAMQLRVRVLDTEHGAVKGARVYVTDAHQREIFTGETNIAGEITASLAPGRYELHCLRDGFQEQTATVIMADADKSITIVLALARQTTAITVSERSPHLDTATEAHQDKLQLGPNQLDIICSIWHC